MRKQLVLMSASVALLAFMASASAQSARGQLERATSGTQSTGVTFDGGKGPTDAYPKGNANVPTPPPAREVRPSTSTHKVQTPPRSSTPSRSGSTSSSRSSGTRKR